MGQGVVSETNAMHLPSLIGSQERIDFNRSQPQISTFPSVTILLISTPLHPLLLDSAWDLYIVTVYLTSSKVGQNFHEWLGH